MLRFALLGLLARHPSHGYELKAAFERLLAGTWPVNIGQIYTTLARLERDGFVGARVESRATAPDRKVYEITEAGRLELKGWLSEPTEGPVRLKDEVFLKVLVHALAGEGDAQRFLWAQREQTLRQLAQLMERETSPDLDPVSALLVSGAVLHAEADLRWLEQCEERLDELGSGGGPDR